MNESNKMRSVTEPLENTPLLSYDANEQVDRNEVSVNQNKKRGQYSVFLTLLLAEVRKTPSTY